MIGPSTMTQIAAALIIGLTLGCFSLIWELIKARREIKRLRSKVTRKSAPFKKEFPDGEK